MKKSQFLPPYKNESKKETTFRGINNMSGVYLIKENEKLVYIGYSSSNLYKTLYRHFQVWNHQTQEVVSYSTKKHKYTVRIVLTTPARACKLEQYLIVKYSPRDNTEKYNVIKNAANIKVFDSYKDCEYLRPSTDPDIF